MASYEPRKGLGSRANLAGLSRASTRAEVQKALGAPDPGGDAAAAEVRFAGDKIVATFDGDQLAKLSVDKDGLAALKKPGLFASLAEPMAKAVARWGAADETHASGAGEAASWAVPSKLLPVFTLTLECDAAACTRMAVAFE